MGSAFTLRTSKTQVLLYLLLGVEISRGAISTLRQHLRAELEHPMHKVLDVARQQTVVSVEKLAPNRQRR